MNDAGASNKLVKWGVVALVLLVLVAWPIATYNGMVSQQEAVKTAWSNVEVQYQRRADLVPNLVEVVKGYAKHEKDVFVQVTQARAGVGRVQVGGDVTPEKIEEFMKAQGALTQALSRLMVVVERYPELKADKRFGELQAQLEGTENRIAYARNKYNEAVRAFNTKIRRFPANLIASLGGFTPYPYFEADKGAQKVPKVKF